MSVADEARRMNYTEQSHVGALPWYSNNDFQKTV